MAPPEDIKYILIFGLLRVVGDSNTFGVVPHPMMTTHCLDEYGMVILIVGGAFCGSPSVAHSGEYDTRETTKDHLSIPESSQAWERINQGVLHRTVSKVNYLGRTLTQYSSMMDSVRCLNVPRQNAQFWNFLLPMCHQA